MIKEIVLNKKYKVLGQEYSRTPLYISNDYVFYEHDYNGYASCTHCRIDDFLKDSEEIPEAPEEWFEVVYRVKTTNSRPCVSKLLFKSKDDFFTYQDSKESDYEFIKLRKVEL